MNMDIEDLTIKQVRELTSLVGGQSKQPGHCENVGKYVIVRSRDAGVLAGILVSKNGDEVKLKDARRIWYWSGA